MNSSSNNLVPKISTISNAYLAKTANANTSQTSFGNGLTPTYWSASQLLKEHEERKRREQQEPTTDNRGFDYTATDGGVGGVGPYYNAYDGYYNNGFHPQQQQQPQHRLSQAESNGGYYGSNQQYLPDNINFNMSTAPGGGSDTDSTIIRNNNNVRNVVPLGLSGSGGGGNKASMPKTSGGSTNSSSLMAGANPANPGSSLQGSLLSLNSTANNNPRPGSISKTRNITQV